MLPRLAGEFVLQHAGAALLAIEADAKRLGCLIEEAGAAWVPGVPVPKGRHRSTRSGRHYTPAKTVKHEQAICNAAIAANLPRVGIEQDEGAIIRIVCVMPRTIREQRRIRDSRVADVSGPDVDNLAKAVLDGLQRDGGPLADDKRVVSVTVDRILAPYATAAGTLVTLAAVVVLDAPS